MPGNSGPLFLSIVVVVTSQMFCRIDHIKVLDMDYNVGKGKNLRRFAYADGQAKSATIVRLYNYPRCLEQGDHIISLSDPST